jgi:flagellum-specific peptidoglycan hydrolase FlgJ
MPIFDYFNKQMAAAPEQSPAKEPQYQQKASGASTNMFGYFSRQLNTPAPMGKDGNLVFKDNDAFFNAIMESAKRNGAMFPELVASQAALESAWGKRQSGRNNFFGQKATSRQSGRSVMTREEIGGRSMRMEQRFRDYESIDEAVRDHITKWQPKYAVAKDARSAAQLLQTGEKRYATDSRYVNKVNSILAARGY